MRTRRKASKKARARSKRAGSPRTLPKVATGIPGFDEITGGGLPQGRPTLVCGGAGCGKTLFAHGVPRARARVEYGEPGVFMTFEETRRGARRRTSRSLGFDLDELIAQSKLADRSRPRRAQRDRGDRRVRPRGAVRPPRLRHRLGRRQARRARHASRRSSAASPTPAILRAELRRLFRWLKDRGVTAVITGERGEGALTRHGLEEYVSDCVILLDHRVQRAGLDPAPARSSSTAARATAPTSTRS